MKSKLKKLKKRQRLNNEKSSSDISTVSNSTSCGQSRHVNANKYEYFTPCTVDPGRDFPNPLPLSLEIPRRFTVLSSISVQEVILFLRKYITVVTNKML
ncbi:hypothetical protein RO3G_02661 [Rhizopus delemar RA 99-880]|uniref:Uncharacterized protein n=1 Tax=Rhizopus delemar (strain RA 99-880 / ATCC MYA-4621 / FGSC 9543 / NRRL 43880) TaxID=246409 RepID=I1BP27_RHIO9|nr:hypothetical protein RO3G_02661 [Rhizopus delemar RA 99-880]|eukprot:EIE77957.1 hypothetical protein RO3G_02661 [Rhizopus delemar RA 99-880]